MLVPKRKPMSLVMWTMKITSFHKIVISAQLDANLQDGPNQHLLGRYYNYWKLRSRLILLKFIESAKLLSVINLLTLTFTIIDIHHFIFCRLTLHILPLTIILFPKIPLWKSFVFSFINDQD